jgi:hypothetical protein
MAPEISVFLIFLFSLNLPQSSFPCLFPLECLPPLALKILDWMMKETFPCPTSPSFPSLELGYSACTNVGKLFDLDLPRGKWRLHSHCGFDHRREVKVVVQKDLKKKEHHLNRLNSACALPLGTLLWRIFPSSHIIEGSPLSLKPPVLQPFREILTQSLSSRRHGYTLRQVAAN